MIKREKRETDRERQTDTEKQERQPETDRENTYTRLKCYRCVNVIVYLQEWRHSIMVVASMRYPPHRAHSRWGFSSQMRRRVRFFSAMAPTHTT